MLVGRAQSGSKPPRPLGSREDEKIRWVPGNDGMELAAAALAAHDIADDKGLLIDRLFTCPVDCCLCHHD
jgi:hypothetical protein